MRFSLIRDLRAGAGRRADRLGAAVAGVVPSGRARHLLAGAAVAGVGAVEAAWTAGRLSTLGARAGDVLVVQVGLSAFLVAVALALALGAAWWAGHDTGAAGEDPVRPVAVAGRAPVHLRPLPPVPPPPPGWDERRRAAA